ncbi:hypothetical protein PR048_023625 [Dryococelus australis]|uniref:Uncharacterized protein n=1 Tax=Dryococelus australis TaxID=614101 RepID=A0ABQ9GUM0_9NEOP|nr:hypothetical protein PR048_023625 [Dryococelus australis]
MEQFRNERARETRDPREYQPTSGIVRHNCHMRKSVSSSAGNRTRFALSAGTNTRTGGEREAVVSPAGRRHTATSTAKLRVAAGDATPAGRRVWSTTPAANRIVTMAGTRPCLASAPIPGTQCRSVTGPARRGTRGIPEEILRPAASSGTIPTCENLGTTPPGIEPGSPRWEVSSLTTTPPRPPDPRQLVRRSVSSRLASFPTARHCGDRRSIEAWLVLPRYGLGWQRPRFLAAGGAAEVILRHQHADTCPACVSCLNNYAPNCMRDEYGLATRPGSRHAKTASTCAAGRTETCEARDVGGGVRMFREEGVCFPEHRLATEGHVAVQTVYGRETQIDHHMGLHKFQIFSRTVFSAANESSLPHGAAEQNAGKQLPMCLTALREHYLVAASWSAVGGSHTRDHHRRPKQECLEYSEAPTNTAFLLALQGWPTCPTRYLTALLTTARGLRMHLASSPALQTVMSTATTTAIELQPNNGHGRFLPQSLFPMQLAPSDDLAVNETSMHVTRLQHSCHDPTVDQYGGANAIRNITYVQTTHVQYITYCEEVTPHGVKTCARRGFITELDHAVAFRKAKKAFYFTTVTRDEMNLPDGQGELYKSVTGLRDELLVSAKVVEFRAIDEDHDRIHNTIFHCFKAHTTLGIGACDRWLPGGLTTIELSNITSRRSILIGVCTCATIKVVYNLTRGWLMVGSHIKLQSSPVTIGASASMILPTVDTGTGKFAVVVKGEYECGRDLPGFLRELHSTGGEGAGLPPEVASLTPPRKPATNTSPLQSYVTSSAMQLKAVHCEIRTFEINISKTIVYNYRLLTGHLAGRRIEGWLTTSSDYPLSLQSICTLHSWSVRSSGSIAGFRTWKLFPQFAPAYRFGSPPSTPRFDLICSPDDVIKSRTNFATPLLISLGWCRNKGCCKVEKDVLRKNATTKCENPGMTLPVIEPGLREASSLHNKTTRREGRGGNIEEGSSERLPLEEGKLPALYITKHYNFVTNNTIDRNVISFERVYNYDAGMTFSRRWRCTAQDAGGSRRRLTAILGMDENFRPPTPI